MVYEQPRIHPGEWDAHNSTGFSDRNRSLNLGQTTIYSDIKPQEKSVWQTVDFAFSMDSRVKIKKKWNERS